MDPRLRLFITADHPCGYLPGQNARNLVVDPQRVDGALYDQLARVGFRRSGDYVYRPHCPNCNACVSLRVAAALFRPNRAQRRTWRKNGDLDIRRVAAGFDSEHYALFRRYVYHRHRNGGMDDTPEDGYEGFIHAAWSTTRLYEFRHAQRLLCVAAVDHLDDGFSAVYTFFEPEEAARSLGTYSILSLIAMARADHLPWVYLGYWIRNCGKMAYKANFQPYQVFSAGRWRKPAPAQRED